MLSDMSRSRVMTFSSLVTLACRPSIAALHPGHVRRSPELLAAPARSMASRATAKSDNPMSKSALVELMLDEGKFETKVAADTAVSAVFDTIMDQVIQGKAVRLLGFGTFSNRSRAARKGRNPSTGQDLEIPPSNAPAFTAGKMFKESVKAGKRTEPTPKKVAGRKKKVAD